MGYNHVTCGLAVGIATLPVAPVHHWSAQAGWVIALGGASLLPDLDTPGSTAARMWGLVTGLLGAAVAVIARGHRQGTHDAVLAPLVFAGFVFLAASHPVSTGVVLALMIGLSLRGLALTGMGRIGASTNLLLSSGGAWWLITSGADEIRLLPAVIAAGVLVHILGDLVTSEGVPVPIIWLLGGRRRISMGLFRVNGALERFLVAPALSLLGVALFFAYIGVNDPASLVEWTDELLRPLP